MNKLILIALFVGIAFAAHGAHHEKHQDTKTLWQQWKQQNGKLYAGAEEAARFAIFSDNVKRIAKLNAQHNGVKYSVNKFADLTGAEFKAQYASGARVETNKSFIQKRLTKFNLKDPLPDSVDWRNKGAVTPVKDQGQCGSCWTFSTTGVIEGFYFINNGKLLSFSEQQIVDCDTTEDEGCNGGWPYLAVEYAGKNGLEVESDYPYTARDGKCKYDSSKAVKTNTGYGFVTPNSTNQLKAALVNGPVSVCIEADQDVFQFYSSGVITTGCGAYLDHAVLAVGYQKVGVVEAFSVKNSWGHSWGADGYVYISTLQTLNKGQGACGILAQPVIAN